MRSEVLLRKYIQSAFCFTSVENNWLTRDVISCIVTTVSFHFLFHFVWSSFFVESSTLYWHDTWHGFYILRNCSRYVAALFFCKLVIFGFIHCIIYSLLWMFIVFLGKRNSSPAGSSSEEERWGTRSFKNIVFYWAAILHKSKLERSYYVLPSEMVRSHPPPPLCWCPCGRDRRGTKFIKSPFKCLSKCNAFAMWYAHERQHQE